MPRLFQLRRPTQAQLQSVLDELPQQQLTYDEVGATSRATPAGYHPMHLRRQLGQGDDVWQRAKTAIDSWAQHHGSGIVLVPETPALAVGTNLVGLTPLGPLWTTITCRVVTVYDTYTHYGLAYGTLPLHAEKGEESFAVERDADGNVFYVVDAFSKAGHWLVRLGGPVARLTQSRALRAYADAVEKAVRG